MELRLCPLVGDTTVVTKKRVRGCSPCVNIVDSWPYLQDVKKENVSVREEKKNKRG